MILYLMGPYGLDMATGANIVFLWSGATTFTPIFGAFLADAYVGRFRMIGFGTVFAFLGVLLLWSTTIIPGLNPSYEEITTLHSSNSSTIIKLIYLCVSLGLMAIGAGGIRSSVVAFGADQLSNIGDEENAKPDNNQGLDSFFTWYYFSTTASMLFALTCIVYVQEHSGWQVGFAIPAMLMLVASLCFFSASSSYLKAKPKASVFTRLAQVVVASWRNRHYKLPSHTSVETVYHVAKGSVVEVPTENLRFLNKACIVMDHLQDLTTDGMAVNPWRLCTTDQVEDLKTIMNLLPLLSTGIMLGVDTGNVLSFVVVQAKSMDRHFITPSFEIPAGSFTTFALLSIMAWLVLYNKIFIPLASKVKGKAVNIDAITRTGFGLLISFMCVVVAGFVENARRSSLEPMSALWLVPQVCLIGLADGIIATAQIEFFYSEFPKSMASISSNLFGLSTSMSSLVSSLIINVVNCITKQDGKESWISNDLNKGHYDYYYWVLAGFSLANCLYFIACSRGYRKIKRGF